MSPSESPSLSPSTEYDEEESLGGLTFGGEVVEEHIITEVVSSGGLVFGGEVPATWQSSGYGSVAVKGGTYRIAGVVYELVNTMTYPGLGDIAALVELEGAPTTVNRFRYDLLSINSSGTITVTKGTEAATPVMPSTPSNEVKLDHVLRYYGQTQIKQSDIGRIFTTQSLYIMTLKIVQYNSPYAEITSLAWGTTQCRVRVYKYDQYGSSYTPSITIASSLAYGNGTISPTTKSGVTPVDGYLEFIYTRGGTVNDVSPSIKFTSSNSVFVTGNLTLLDVSGNPMY